MVGVSAALHLQRRRRDVVLIAELEGIRDWEIHAALIEVEGEISRLNQRPRYCNAGPDREKDELLNR
jgi:hypothetical protein